MDGPLDRLFPPDRSGSTLLRNSKIRMITEILLAHGDGAPMNMAGLEQIACTSHGSVARALDDFAEHGLVRREPHGRSILIQPTPFLVMRFNEWARDFVERNRSLIERLVKDESPSRLR
jgi:DNA-binding IclR family transcriptional regulator